MFTSVLPRCLDGSDRESTRPSSALHEQSYRYTISGRSLMPERQVILACRNRLDYGKKNEKSQQGTH